jgi:hypothetical protein
MNLNSQKALVALDNTNLRELKCFLRFDQTLSSICVAFFTFVTLFEEKKTKQIDIIP